MIITILGSCRQDSLYNIFFITKDINLMHLHQSCYFGPIRILTANKMKYLPHSDS